MLGSLTGLFGGFACMRAVCGRCVVIHLIFVKGTQSRTHNMHSVQSYLPSRKNKLEKKKKEKKNNTEKDMRAHH